MEGFVLALSMSKVLLLVLSSSAELVELELSEILVAIEVFETFSVLVASKHRTVAAILVNKYICKIKNSKKFLHILFRTKFL